VYALAGAFARAVAAAFDAPEPRREGGEWLRERFLRGWQRMVAEYLGKPDATVARTVRYDLLDSTEGVRQMSWVIDVASSMGIPAGAATLAVSMYAGCSAAEKAARPEALQDIARILKDPSWSRAVRPVSIIERLFRWTFGARQLSWKCVRRSIMATLMFSVSLMMIYSVMWKTVDGGVNPRKSGEH
jgi:hypothetical protein